MPVVTTLKVNKITRFGHKFLRGVPFDGLTYQQAMELQADRRFKVEITPKEHQQAVLGLKGERPKDRNVRVERVAEAIKLLSTEKGVGSKDDYRRDGKPDCRKLSSMLSWQVTMDDRDRALRYLRSQISANGTQPEMTDAGSPEDRGDLKAADLKKRSQPVKDEDADEDTDEEDDDGRYADGEDENEDGEQFNGASDEDDEEDDDDENEEEVSADEEEAVDIVATAGRGGEATTGKKTRSKLRLKSGKVKPLVTQNPLPDPSAADAKDIG